MVTVEKPLVNVYKLHFVDWVDAHHYQIVLSRNIDTLRYYAKKLFDAKGWFLADFYEFTIYNDHLWLTRYILRYKRDVNGNIRRRLYCIADINRHFNQFFI